MRIDTKRSDVAVEGMKGQRAFTVEAGAHIMAVLSGLYKDPVDAMVREYLTNMYDAYIALRRVNPTAEIIPPELHIPSRMDGNLSFTDFGIGMDKDQVWEIYSTYGKTTKDGDNSEVGGFGLGSKTAFCYNGGASWMIEARKNGVKNVFTAFIGADGVPQLTHVSETPSDEHSGVTVSIPLLRNDVHLVRDAVSKYAPYFPMELKITGETTNVNIDKPTYRLKSDKWGFQASNGYGTNTARVIMGNVPYPVDFDKFQVANKDFAEFNHFLRRNRVDLFVDIGAVNIVPSRDSLMYTPMTIKTIQDTLQAMRSELAVQLETTIAACTTEWDAITQLRVVDDMGALGFVPTVKWNGKNISTHAVTRTVKSLKRLDPSATVSQYVIDNGRAKIEMHDLMDDATMEISPKKNHWLLYNDMPKGGALMARALLHEKCVSKTRSGRAASWGHQTGHTILITTSLPATKVAEFFGGMPVDQVLSVAALKGTVAVPQSLKVTKDTIYRWSGTSWAARVNVPNDPNVTYYYLPLTKNGHRYSYNNTYRSQKDVMQYLDEYSEKFGLDVAVIYGMKKDNMPNLPSNWVNLEDAVRAKIIDTAKNNLEDLALVTRGISHEMQKVKELIVGADLHESKIPSIVQLHSDFEKFERASSNKIVQNVFNASSHLTLDDSWRPLLKDVKTPDFTSQSKVIFDQYPMLDVVAQISTGSFYSYSSRKGHKSKYSPYKKQLLDYLKSM